MKVLVKSEYTKPPVVQDIPNELAALQSAVGGYIELLPANIEQEAWWEEPAPEMVMDEEGKLKGLPITWVIYSDTGALVEEIAGTFLVVGVEGDQFRSLTDQEIDKYARKFSLPF